MTNRNKKRRRPPASSGYRAPATTSDASQRSTARPGLFASLFTPRVASDSAMPRLRTCVARGVVTVLGQPLLVVGIALFVFLVWLGCLAVGFQGPVARLASLLSLPPVGTTFDAQLSGALFGVAGGTGILIGVLPFILARAVVIGVLLGLIVEVLEGGRITLTGARRGLWASPMVLIVSIIQLGFLILGSFLAPIAGAALGTLVQIGAVVAALYLFVYAPISFIREDRGLLDSLSRSTRAARIPGTGGIGMAMLYVVPSVAILLFGGPGGGYDVNPGAGVWAFVLGVNLLHVCGIATFAYRWMCIEDEVPEAPVRAPAPARRARR